MPWELAEGPATLVLTVGDKSSNVATFDVVSAAPGIIYANDSRAAALNQDTTLNATDRPAKVGSIITVYLTGQGAVDRPVATGAAAPANPRARTVWPVSATIGGRDAPVKFSGLAPGYVGLMQLNIEVPDIPAGDYPVVVTIRDRASNAALVTTAR